MTTFLQYITPESRGWFAANVSYEGWGTARLLTDEGVIEGPTTIIAREDGLLDISMAVSRSRSGSVNLSGLGEPAADLQISRHGPATDLTVDTDTGQFVADFATTSIFQPPPLGFSASEELLTTIHFYPLDAEFRGSNSTPVEYWVIPLTNFLADFTLNDPRLDHHPLRIFEPSDLTVQARTDQDRLRFPVRVPGNAIIPFSYGGGLGFVEPLPDYDSRHSDLLTSRVPSRVTSVMVGRMNGEAPGKFSYHDWLPTKLLSILGLASGTPVGGPWVELRDGDGNLCRRIHVRLNVHPYFFHRALIDETLHVGGISQLLSLAETSDRLRNTDFEAWIRRLTRAGNPAFTVDESLAHLFLTLEGLTQATKVSHQHGPWHQLGEDTKGFVSRSVSHAVKTIQIRAKQADEDGATEEAAALREIATNLIAAKKYHPRPSFRHRFESILDESAFADRDVLDQYFALNPGPNGSTSYVEVVKEYRDTLIHRGVLDYRSGFADVRLTYSVRNHVYDLLARLFLKDLGYGGTYQPQTATWNDAKPIDWVSTTTDKWWLGF